MSDERTQVLEWCQKQLSSYEDIAVFDFEYSWNDGLALNYLIHSMRPEFFDIESVKKQTPAERMIYVLDVIEILFEINTDLDYLHLERSDEAAFFNLLNSIHKHYKKIYGAVLQMGAGRLRRQEMSDEEFKVLKWCLRQLHPYENVEIRDLQYSWSDGIALCALIHSMRPEFFDLDQLQIEEPWKRMLRALEIVEQVFKIEPNMGVEQTEKPDKTKIFNLLRQLHNYYKRIYRNQQEHQKKADGQSGSVGNQLVRRKPEEAQVLHWCQQKTANYENVNVVNFTDSWKDGMALNALVDSLRTGVIFWDQLVPGDTYTNIQNGLEAAEQLFGIPATTEVEKIAASNHDVIFNLIRQIHDVRGLFAVTMNDAGEVEADVEEPAGNIEDVAAGAADGADFLCSVCGDAFGINRGLSCRNSGLNEPTAEPNEIHRSFCLECLENLATALCTGGKLAPFGMGLLCVEPGCNNIYPWAVVRRYISVGIRRLLQLRIDNEALMAISEEVESCKNCPFVMEFMEGVEEDPYFNCIACAAMFCRRCKVDFADHRGKACEEVEVGKATERTAREEDLSNNKIRQCHRCNVRFAKDGGCNNMTCQCGATQCYCCRATDTEYRHFCSHRFVDGQCQDRCGRKCILFDNEEDDEFDGENFVPGRGSGQ